MKKIVKQLRQGDVFLQPVSKLPAGAKELPIEGNRIVLAFGEVTGHAHAIRFAEADAKRIADGWIAKLYEHRGDRFLEVKEPVYLKHEEHTEHVIPPGVYELPVQVEWNSEHAPRQVAD